MQLEVLLNILSAYLPFTLFTFICLIFMHYSHQALLKMAFRRRHSDSSIEAVPKLQVPTLQSDDFTPILAHIRATQEKLVQAQESNSKDISTFFSQTFNSINELTQKLFIVTTTLQTVYDNTLRLFELQSETVRLIARPPNPPQDAPLSFLDSSVDYRRRLDNSRSVAKQSHALLLPTPLQPSDSLSPQVDQSSAGDLPHTSGTHSGPFPPLTDSIAKINTATITTTITTTLPGTISGTSSTFQPRTKPGPDRDPFISGKLTPPSPGFGNGIARRDSSQSKSISPSISEFFSPEFDLSSFNYSAANLHICGPSSPPSPPIHQQPGLSLQDRLSSELSSSASSSHTVVRSCHSAPLLDRRENSSPSSTTGGLGPHLQTLPSDSFQKLPTLRGSLIVPWPQNPSPSILLTHTTATDTTTSPPVAQHHRHRRVRSVSPRRSPHHISSSSPKRETQSGTFPPADYFHQPDNSPSTRRSRRRDPIAARKRTNFRGPTIQLSHFPPRQPTETHPPKRATVSVRPLLEGHNPRLNISQSSGFGAGPQSAPNTVWSGTRTPGPDFPSLPSQVETNKSPRPLPNLLDISTGESYADQIKKTTSHYTPQKTLFQPPTIVRPQAQKRHRRSQKISSPPDTKQSTLTHPSHPHFPKPTAHIPSLLAQNIQQNPPIHQKLLCPPQKRLRLSVPRKPSAGLRLNNFPARSTRPPNLGQGLLPTPPLSQRLPFPHLYG